MGRSADRADDDAGIVEVVALDRVDDTDLVGRVRRVHPVLVGAVPPHGRRRRSRCRTRPCRVLLIHGQAKPATRRAKPTSCISFPDGLAHLSQVVEEAEVVASKQQRLRRRVAQDGPHVPDVVLAGLHSHLRSQSVAAVLRIAECGEFVKRLTGTSPVWTL